MTSSPRYSEISAADCRKRVEALKMMAVLDTPPEDGYDALTRLAARVCQMPIALISLIDGDRLWFKSAVGVDARQIDSRYSFCCEAANSMQLLHVGNAREDPRFAGNGLVCGALGIQFYAGAPIMYQGVSIGTVCVLDRVPRQMTADQQEALMEMANIAGVMLRARIEAFHLMSATTH